MGLGLLAVGFLIFGIPGAAQAGSGSTVTPKTTGTVQAFMTLYGYVDNSPPGTDIAHPCGTRTRAGGTGTYADPVTFATDRHELP